MSASTSAVINHFHSYLYNACSISGNHYCFSGNITRIRACSSEVCKFLDEPQQVINEMCGYLKICKFLDMYEGIRGVGHLNETITAYQEPSICEETLTTVTVSYQNVVDIDDLASRSHYVTNITGNIKSQDLQAVSDACSDEIGKGNVHIIILLPFNSQEVEDCCVNFFMEKKT